LKNSSHLASFSNKYPLQRDIFCCSEALLLMCEALLLVGPFWLLIVVSCLHLSLRSSYMHSYLFVYSVLKHCAHTSCCLHVIAFALLMYHYVHRVCTCHYVPRTCTRITTKCTHAFALLMYSFTCLVPRLSLTDLNVS
jgi:hypothetical protein